MTDSPPFNKAAERDFVATLLGHPDSLIDVVGIVRPEDLHTAPLRLIYQAILGLHDRGRPVDLPAIGELLSTDNDLQRVGGAPALATLSGFSANPALLRHTASIVREHGTRREVRELLQDRVGELSSLPLGLKDHALEDALLSLSAEVWQAGRGLQHGKRDATTARELVLAVIEDLEARDTPPGIPTGIRCVDEVVSGWRGGDLIVFGGRPGEGKSILLVQFGLLAAQSRVRLNGSRDPARKVLWATAEMGKEQLGTRFLSREALVSGFRMLQRRLNSDERERLHAAAERLRPIELKVWEAIRARPQDIRAEALRMQREGGLDLIVVDYLQRLRPPRDVKGQARYVDVGDIARELKETARELDVPVVTASQLSRDVTGRRPLLSDLRESGDIEQEADLVGLLWRPLDDHGAIIHNRLAILWEKHRMGPTGESLGEFNPACCMFRDAPLEGVAPVHLGSSTRDFTEPDRGSDD